MEKVEIVAALKEITKHVITSSQVKNTAYPVEGGGISYAMSVGEFPRPIVWEIGGYELHFYLKKEIDEWKQSYLSRVEKAKQSGNDLIIKGCVSC